MAQGGRQIGGCVGQFQCLGAQLLVAAEHLKSHHLQGYSPLWFGAKHFLHFFEFIKGGGDVRECNGAALVLGPLAVVDFSFHFVVMAAHFAFELFLSIAYLGDSTRNLIGNVLGIGGLIRFLAHFLFHFALGTGLDGSAQTTELSIGGHCQCHHCDSDNGFYNQSFHHSLLVFR